MSKILFKKFWNFTLTVIICFLIGRLIGLSFAFYQNKKDAEITPYLKVNKACMIQTEEDSEPELNCIEFIDKSSYRYNI